MHSPSFKCWGTDDRDSLLELGTGGNRVELIMTCINAMANCGAAWRKCHLLTGEFFVLYSFLFVPGEELN